MNASDLRAVQAPLKDRYRETPQAALITLRAQGRIGEGVSCKIKARHLSLPGCILPPAVRGTLPVRATCCSKPWLPVLA